MKKIAKDSGRHRPGSVTRCWGCVDPSAMWTSRGWLERWRFHTQPSHHRSFYFLYKFLILLVLSRRFKTYPAPTAASVFLPSRWDSKHLFVLLVLVMFLTHIKELECSLKEWEPMKEKFPCLSPKLFSPPVSTIDSPCLLYHEAALAPVMRTLYSCPL